MQKWREAIRKHRDGAVLKLFVTPSADCAVFPAGYNPWRKQIEIKVCSEARDNKANKEVLKTVAAFFNKTNDEVLFVSGEKSREKTLLVKNVSIDEVFRRLEEYL